MRAARGASSAVGGNGVVGRGAPPAARARRRAPRSPAPALRGRDRRSSTRTARECGEPLGPRLERVAAGQRRAARGEGPHCAAPASRGSPAARLHGRAQAARGRDRSRRVARRGRPSRRQDDRG